MEEEDASGCALQIDRKKKKKKKKYFIVFLLIKNIVLFASMYGDPKMRKGLLFV